MRLFLLTLLLLSTLYAKPNSNDDEELRLMLQAFLYSDDLQHAYITAKLGYEKEPNSLYWNKKMAEVCQWSGRSHEAIKYMKFLYFHQYNSKIANEIIDLGLNSYQYKDIKRTITTEVLRNPSKKNRTMLLYIYSKIGISSQAAKLLEKLYQEHPSHPEYLEDALKVYMQTGNLNAAYRIIHIIEKKGLYTPENIKLIASFYYSKKNMQDSLQALTKMIDTKQYNKEYFQLLSDLGWYLKNFQKSATASLALIQHNDGRIEDYERVISFQENHNRKLAGKIALEAYVKFHHSYLFYTFANEMIRENNMEALQEAFKKLNREGKRKNPLRKDSQYWLIKSLLLHSKGKKEATKKALHKALTLRKNSLTIRFTVLSYYQEFQMYNALQNELLAFSADTTLPHKFYFAMASFAFGAHNINLANYYMQQLLAEQNPTIHTTAFKFLQADIENARNNHNGYISILEKIVQQLKAKLKKNPHLATNDEYLYNLIRAEISLRTSDSLLKKLKKAKPYLSKAHYNDLQYSIAMKTKSFAKAHQIYLHTSPKAIWLQFSDAINEQNHTQMENLLAQYLYTLAKDDASYAAQNDGQIALAQSLSYDSLNTNEANQNAYIALLGLSKERTNLTSIQTTYALQEPLQREYITLQHSHYIRDNYYILAHLRSAHNLYFQKSKLQQIPTITAKREIGVQKLFNKAELTLLMGYRDAIKSFFFYSLSGSYRVTQPFTLSGGLYKNIETKESTALAFGGKKDKISIAMNYQIVDTTSLNLLYEHNQYSSQDNHALGTGEYMRVNLSHQIRNGYPDMKLSLFSNSGFYYESSLSRGVVARLQPLNSAILPNNFTDFGIDFAYGMRNSTLYTRVWRGYFELNSYYNKESSNWSYGANVGYGGKLFSQDHLTLGANYSSSLEGIGGKNFTLFLKYQFLSTP